MVNVFRLCSIINSLYGQVAGDLETCSRLWRITHVATSPLAWGRHELPVMNKFPSPLPPDRTTKTVML